MVAIAAQLRDALNNRDMDAFRSLIAPDATWGTAPPNACHSRDDIFRTYKRLLAEGVRGTVSETMTGPLGVACLLEIDWPDDADQRRGLSLYQVFRVNDGLVTEILGTDDREFALGAISN